MKQEFEQIRPDEIERRSFEIITQELKGRTFPKEQEDNRQKSYSYDGGF